MLPRVIWMLLLLVTAPATCQQVPLGQGPLTSFGQTLARHHVKLSKQALIDALRDPDPSVRSAAAMKLAEDRATDATPALKDALDSEKLPVTRIDIAAALARLGDHRGLIALDEVCTDNAAPADLRLSAANDMFDVGEDACLDVITALMSDHAESEATRDARKSALALLARFHNLADGDLETMTELALTSLASSDATERFYAASALRSLGNTRAIPYLKTAAQKETNTAANVAINNALVTLQKKYRQ